MTDGFYETVLVEEGRIRLLDRHLARLAAAGVDDELVRLARRQLLDACAAPSGPTVVRVDVDESGVRLTRRAPRPATPVQLVTTPGYDPADASRMQKRADREWTTAPEAAAGPDEALLVSPAGLVGETTTANVFALVGEVVVTPPVEGLLPGVTRGWVVEETGATQRRLTVPELSSAATVFLTSAGRGVVQVAAVDGRSVDPHPIVERLHRAWVARRD